MILAVVVTALLFDPVRKWIQDRVDQFFYRAVYDLSGESGSGWCHAPGQSGHPASSNYADLVDGWLQARLEPLPFGEAPPSGRRLVLEPRGES